MSAKLADVVGQLERAGLVEPGRETPGPDPTVHDVEHDSRQVTAGSLFCCVVGQTTDGHDHAAAAVDAGAIALLAQRPLELGVPCVLVDDVRRAMGHAAAEVHGHPSEYLDVVGITGTNGKTTTTQILSDILRFTGRATTTIGTLTGARTTPEAPELQRVLADARQRGDSAVAMEVSSHALDQHRVDGMRFRAVAFTNLGIDHLDHHKTVERYFAAKAQLFDPARADVAVINVTNPHGRLLADTTTIPTVRINDNSVELISSNPVESVFKWRDHLVTLPLGGDFNVANAAVAAELAVALGVQAADVAAALGQVDSIPGRFESVEEGQDFAVIVDYAHTPDGLEAILHSAREVAERNLVVVFGAGGDRDVMKRPKMGRAAGIADRVVVTSDNPRSEDPNAIIAAIVTGMDRQPDVIEPDRRLAIRHAVAGARQGDVVVIAGKGHETTQTIGATVVEFDDRAVAREELIRMRDKRR